MAPARGFVERDGLRIGYLDWGGDGEPLVFLHPTGFCAGFFAPLAERVTDHFRPIGIDLRAHGASDSPPSEAGYAYVEHAADVLTVLDHLEVSSAVGLGISLGGGVLGVVDQLRPGAWRKIALCEAIAFEQMGMPGVPNPMAAVARKRQRVFESRDAMLASYRTKPVFAGLAPEWLEAYVEWGTVVADDGTVTLACDPDDEADVFIACSSDIGAPTAWRHLPDLACDAVVAAGHESDLLFEWFKDQAERANAPFVEIDGGHFFLAEDTDRAERMTREWLA